MNELMSSNGCPGMGKNPTGSWFHPNLSSQRSSVISPPSPSLYRGVTGSERECEEADVTQQVKNVRLPPGFPPFCPMHLASLSMQG